MLKTLIISLLTYFSYKDINLVSTNLGKYSSLWVILDNQHIYLIRQANLYNFSLEKHFLPKKKTPLPKKKTSVNYSIFTPSTFNRINQLNMHLLIVLSKIHFVMEQRRNVVVRKWDHLCYLQCGVHFER